MQDEIVGRMWAAHHQQFSDGFGNAAASAGRRVRRGLRAVPMRLKAGAMALAASVATLLAAVPPALAQPAQAVQVPYGDLALGTAAGRATLEARLRGAARRVCGPAVSGGVAERQARASCYSAALNKARPQIAHALAPRGSAAPLSVTVR